MAAYDQRIATRITRDYDKRLRVAAALSGKRLSALLTDVIVQLAPGSRADRHGS